MKLLFVCNNMHVGGIQRSLVNLLNEISDVHEVTLLLMYPEGEYMSSLNKNIRILGGNRFTEILGMTQGEAREKGIFPFVWRSLWVILTRIFSSRLTYGLLSRFQKIKEPFDAAVSFMQNSQYRYFYGGINEFVINSTKARRKIAFIHCDYKNYIGNNPYNRGYYRHFDRIACVSDSCRKVFEEECPECKDKAFTVPNCYNFSEMEALSEEYEAERTDGAVNILTCARISEEKGIFRMIPIFSEMKEKGFGFVWRIAGDGPLFLKAAEAVKQSGLSSRIIFLGMLKNPYPYYRASDLLLVPSYNEAAPMVFGEAGYFNLPVLSTKTTSAVEMISDKGAGFVCENNDGAIKSALEEILAGRHIKDAGGDGLIRSNEEALAAFEKIIM